MERAKECRGIKREQKGRRGLPSLRRSRESLLLSSFVLTRSTRPRYSSLLSCSRSPLLISISVFCPCSCLLLPLPLDKSPNFSSHTTYLLFILSPTIAEHSTATLSLSRLLARRTMRYVGERRGNGKRKRKRGGREVQIFSECRLQGFVSTLPCTSMFYHF